MRITPLAALLAALCALSPLPAAADGAAPRPIGQLLGRDAQALPPGRTATLEGVVTANFAASQGGFFVQDGGDGDAATPDAIFVADAQAAALQPGDRVRVRGTLSARDAGAPAGSRNVIEAESTQRLAQRQALPLQVLTAPPADWRALQGMRVRIDAPLTVTTTDALAKSGELGVAFGGRLWQPSEVAAPGSAEQAAVVADNARRALRLATPGAPAAAAPAYLAGAQAPNVGTALQGVEGIVEVAAGVPRLYLTEALRLPAAARPAPPQVAGTLRVAAFNLENLFNGDGRGGGFPTPRGARSPAELQAQLAKLVATIRPLQADVAALMELENDGYGAESAVATLVAALNADGAGPWRYVDAGRGPGDNPIRVGLIYRANRVSPVGRPAVLEGGPFAEHSRVPLAQAFRRVGGQPFVVVANHFKSKGCSEARGDDADRGDGQGCWNATRRESARRLDAWLRSDPTGSGSALTVLLGDFNAYAMEDPLRLLREAGWRDALAQARGARPYSFVYRGYSGRLDHALLSPALAQRLRGAAEWHVNADLPDDAGYRERNLPGPWRSSDHDPLLLGFEL
ncbi:ExeM/NucH family extracellular endonuclease [Xanthomonas sp. AmX2]|uniref:ExeM/NucH family extracellular endonuclease n=1 Tax=Xanthomonas sp. TaxID=29446 RepID=UPI001981898A|nr:ExeM/NucH family extracellular endonuclease [Xanthomonas sp.]MBN6149084.1 ExeM/NucH family extracellular endonuclease [Xanthomonas sp.]